MFRLAFFYLSIFLLFACGSSDKATLDNKMEDEAVTEEASVSEEQIVSNEVSKDPENQELETMGVFDPDVISGRWEAEDADGFSFDLRFYVEDGFISGQYCAMNETATRIDCGEMGDEECYVRGPWIRDGGSLILEVKSCYGHKTGEAEIHFEGEQLKWVLMVEPGKQGVDHFAPLEALLTKVHFDPFE